MWELEYVKSGRCAAGDSATYFVAVESYPPVLSFTIVFGIHLGKILSLKISTGKPRFDPT